MNTVLQKKRIIVPALALCVYTFFVITGAVAHCRCPFDDCTNHREMCCAGDSMSADMSSVASANVVFADMSCENCISSDTPLYITKPTEKNETTVTEHSEFLTSAEKTCLSHNKLFHQKKYQNILSAANTGNPFNTTVLLF